MYGDESDFQSFVNKTTRVSYETEVGNFDLYKTKSADGFSFAAYGPDDVLIENITSVADF